MSRVITTITGVDELTPVLNRAGTSVNNFAAKTQANMNKVVPTTSAMNGEFRNTAKSLRALSATTMLATGDFSSLGGVLRGMPALFNTMGVSGSAAGAKITAAFSSVLLPLALIAGAIYLIIKLVKNNADADKEATDKMVKNAEERRTALEKEQANYRDHLNRMRLLYADYLEATGKKDEADILRIEDQRDREVAIAKKALQDSNDATAAALEKEKQLYRDKSVEILKQQGLTGRAAAAILETTPLIATPAMLEKQSKKNMAAQKRYDDERVRIELAHQARITKSKQDAADVQNKDLVKSLKKDLDIIKEAMAEVDKLTKEREKNVIEIRFALMTPVEQEVSKIEDYWDDLISKADAGSTAYNDLIKAKAEALEKFWDEKNRQDQDRQDEANKRALDEEKKVVDRLNKLRAEYTKRNQFTPQFMGSEQLWKTTAAAFATQKAEDPSVAELEAIADILMKESQKEDRRNARMIAALTGRGAAGSLTALYGD